MNPGSIILFTVTVLLLAGLAGACEGRQEPSASGEATLRTYFQELERLHIKLDDEVYDAIYENWADFNSSDWARRTGGMRDMLTETHASVASLMDGLTVLDPPAELEEVHHEYVQINADAVATIEEMLHLLENVKSEADLVEIDRLAEQGLLGDPQPQIDGCLELEGFAAGRGILVDLRCEG